MYVYSVKIENQDFLAHFSSKKKAIQSIKSFVNSTRIPTTYISLEDLYFAENHNCTGTNVFVKGCRERAAILTKIFVL